MKRWLCLSLVLLVLVIPHSFVEARSYRLLDLVIDARVGADGLVRVTETHTMKFDGTYTGFSQWMETDQGQKVRDVVVSEGGMPYIRLDGDSPGPRGTYFVRETNDQVYVDWSFEATNEVREFEVSYVLYEAVLKHSDVAEFYYQFVGDQWDRGREHVRIVLSLPFGAALDEVAAWGHGPLHGTVSIESPSQIVWEVENLPARTFVEGRVVFPNSLVPGGTRYSNENRLQAIFDEELGKERSQRTAQIFKNWDRYAAVIVFILALTLATHIWRGYGKPEPGYQDRYYKRLPADYPPAELAILYRRATDGRDFTATLLDLARRGFLTIEEVMGLQGKRKQEESSYKFTKKEVGAERLQALRPYEARVLKLLFEDMGAEEVTLEDFQKYAKKNAKSFASFWEEWGQEVKESAKKHSFFDDSAKKVLWFLIPALSLFVLAVLAFVLGMNITGAFCLATGFVMAVVVAVAASRRSAQGHQEYTKWRAFHRYLLESSRVDTVRVGSLGIWEEFLPYAITLGAADQMLKQLAISFPNLEQDGYYYGSHWFIFHHPTGITRISHMTNTVGKSVSSVTMPGGSGTGGGFSGGGGGGMGGGGGGAR